MRIHALSYIHFAHACTVSDSHAFSMPAVHICWTCPASMLLQAQTMLGGALGPASDSARSGFFSPRVNRRKPVLLSYVVWSSA